MKIINTQYFKIIISYFLGLALLPNLVRGFLESLNIETINGYIGVLTNTLVYSIIFIIIWIFLRKTLINEVSTFFKKFKKNMLLSVLFLVILSASFVALTYLTSYFVDTNSSINQQSLMRLYNQQPVLCIITTVLIVSFIEDVVFRGVLLSIISERIGLISGVVLSSVLFGLLHVASGDLIYLPIYTILGLIIALSYVKSKTLQRHTNNTGMGLRFS